MRVPIIGWKETDEAGPGYWSGLALDELVAWMRGHGASESDIEERLQDAFDLYDENRDEDGEE